MSHKDKADTLKCRQINGACLKGAGVSKHFKIKVLLFIAT